MKKNYILMSGLVLATAFGFSQSIVSPGVMNQQASDKITSELKPEDLSTKKINLANKAVGDTIFYEDFAGGLPTGWSIVNNNANNAAWEWNTVYRAGQFSQAFAAGIQSTTAANGFMSLPADFYNTPLPGLPISMDTYFQSDSIDLTNGGANPTGFASVWVTYQQLVRYCCNNSNRLVLQVSSDDFTTSPGTPGTNTFEYDATDDLDVNAANTSAAVGGTTNIINISSAAAGKSNIKIRFYSEANSHYFWMIDDFAVIEGSNNDMELNNPFMEFNESGYTYYPTYGQIPYDLFPPLPFFGNLRNNGSNPATGVTLDVEVLHNSLPNGGAGLGPVYSISTASTPSTILPDSSYSVLTGSPRFVPTVLGNFQVNFLANMDSVDQWNNIVGIEDNTQFFSTSDTVFARDDNGLSGAAGPGSYQGGGQVGDKFGTLYIIESRTRTTSTGTNYIPTSVTYLVTADSQNIGQQIVPQIWAYEEDSLFSGSASVDAAVGAVVAGSFSPYTVTAADLDTELVLTFDNGPATTNGLDSGTYIVGWEVVGTPVVGDAFEVYNDASTGAIQAPVTNFMNLNDGTPVWNWTDDNPAIRLNMGNLNTSTSIAKTVDAKVDFNVAPNPNKGLFKLTVSTDVVTKFNLNVRNMLGQIVYTDVINVNGTHNEQMDLTSFEKGVYFVTLENGSQKLLKKVVVQ